LKVATISFEKNLVIETEEEAQRMIDAIEAADARGPLKLQDFSVEFAAGKEIIKKGIHN